MNLLENYPTYSHFSNEAWYPNDAGSYDSLESLHDQIHGLVGTNGGHMAYVGKPLIMIISTRMLLLFNHVELVL